MKPKELDSKMGKALELAGLLAGVDDDKAKAGSKELSSMIDHLGPVIDIFNVMTSKLSDRDVANCADQWVLLPESVKLLGNLPADCLHAILTDIGRSFTEAHFFHCSFFKIIGAL